MLHFKVKFTTFVHFHVHIIILNSQQFYDKSDVEILTPILQM